MIAPLTIVSLWEIMNTVYVGTMFEALLNAGTLADNANAAIVAKQPLYIPESHYAEFMRHMVLLEKAGNELAMPVIARHAYIVKGALEKAAVDGLDRRIDFRELVEMRTSASQLRSNSPIELHAQKFLSLSRADAMLFDGVDEWGGDVVARFKSARYDIHEGAKCLGLGRSTASVFHFIRVLETGLRALRAHVGVVAPLVGAERNWGAIQSVVRYELSDPELQSTWSIDVEGITTQ